MGEFPGSEDYFVAENRVFINQNSHFAIVVHKTASAGTAESQGVFFQTNPEMKSVHYVVGQDGKVVQCVLEKDGAGGNCCLENGYETFWDKAPTKANLNLCTISIEHCDPTQDNSTPLTPEQTQSSFRLISYLCHKYHIGVDHIKGHNTIAPIRKSRCPGNYPWQGLFSYLEGEGMATTIPAGWNDDGSTLTAPNGHKVIKGFRQFVLDNNWDHNNQPLGEEYYPPSVEESNISMGPGAVQIFNDNSLEWTRNDNKIFIGNLGKEYLFVKADRDNQKTIIEQLQHQIATLQQGIPSSDISNLEAQLNKLQQDIQAFKR